MSEMAIIFGGTAVLSAFIALIIAGRMRPAEPSRAVDAVRRELDARLDELSPDEWRELIRISKSLVKRRALAQKGSVQKGEHTASGSHL